MNILLSLTIIFQVFNYSNSNPASDIKSIKNQLGYVFPAYKWKSYRAKINPSANQTNFTDLYSWNYSALKHDRINLIITDYHNTNWCGLSNLGYYGRWKGLTLATRYGTRKTRRSIMLHETIHALGAMHLNNRACNMYPVALAKRRICFSTRRTIRKALKQIK